MKKKIPTAIFTGVLLMLLSLLPGCAKKAKIGDITVFRYHFTNGYARYAYTDYELERKDGGYTARRKPSGVPDEKADVFTVDAAFAEKLKAILKEYGVGSWNGFNKSDKHVLDGNSFSLTVYMGEEEISAHGYMRWPKNYREFKEAVTALFEGLKQ